MTKQEMIQQAQLLRSRDAFGALSEEELAALPGTETVLDIPSDHGGSVRVYEIRPSTPLSSPAPMVINFHGGGFIKGRSARDKRYCCFLAEALSCLVWDVDYVLAPEAPFPAAVDQCYDVAAYVFSHTKVLGVHPGRIAVVGHSAGGNLAAAIQIKDAAIGHLHPCGLIMEYFPGDHTADPMDRLTAEQRQNPRAAARAETERMYQAFYCDASAAGSPLCSPLKAARQELEHFPDCLVLSADLDSLKEETEAFAAMLVQAGVTVTAKRIPGAMHGFSVNRTDKWEQALSLHREFLSRQFGRIPQGAGHPDSAAVPNHKPY